MSAGISKPFSTDALVLRESEYGENDRLVTLLSPVRGKLTVIAKGARSLRSQIRAGIQPFTYANFEIAERSGPGYIRAVSVIESFPGVRSDLRALSLASYLSDLAADLSGEGVPTSELLSLTLNAFYLLSKGAGEGGNGEKTDELFRRVKSAYELRAMALSGYTPNLTGCETCGKRESELWYLDVMNGGLLCPDCLRRRSSLPPTRPSPDDMGSATLLLPLLPGACDAARYILSAPAKRVYLFSFPDPEDAKSFERASEEYVLNHLERGFDTLNFYKSLN